MMDASRVTLFAIPKPFTGISEIIQENALRSWTRLPNVDVIVFGRDEGVEEAAARYGLQHDPDIEYSSMGTPLLSSAFAAARRMSDAPTLCYVNADIMLFEDFLRTAGSVSLPEALIVARRRNVDVREVLEVASDPAREAFLAEARRAAILENPFGSDVFLFPRHIDWGMPRFAVGRPAWDNWLMFRALAMKIPLVDVTADTFVVHQNHDYTHVPGRRGEQWEGPEADANRSLFSIDQTASLLDATYVLIRGRLHRPRGKEYLRARILMWGKRSQLVAVPLTAARVLFRVLKKVAAAAFKRTKSIHTRR